MAKVIKKDNTIQNFDDNKIINAIKKASDRIVIDIPNEKIIQVVNFVKTNIKDKEYVTINELHNLVEIALLNINNRIADSYKEYRNYKRDFVSMMDEVYQESEKIRYIADRSNANSDGKLITTQRSLIYNKLNKELYKKFFLNNDERQAINDGYIYIHDIGARLDTTNCLLADIKSILKDGFELGNFHYNEPKTLSTAFDVIGDIVTAFGSSVYGGITIPEVDTLLSKYAEKSYNLYYNEYLEIVKNDNFLYNLSAEPSSLLLKAQKYAEDKVRRDFEQGFQGWELKFNTIGSSRGDYVFVATSFGLETSKFGQMATESILKVRKNGQGKKGFKKVALFPKLTFLYDENLHGQGKELEHLFNCAIDCSSKSMYPDYLSLSGEGYISEVYKKYGKVISLMGCRSSLSLWFEKGGMYPQNDDDKPVFIGRGNLGVISLNLPMIYQKAKVENKDFYDTLDFYLEMIRNLHKRTKTYLGNKKASINPLGFCEGGFYKGYLKPDDKIAPVLESFTYSYGITALNELNRLHNGKSIYEDGEFPLEVMKYINDKINIYKKQDHMLYSIYGTPAETLAGTQVQQFRKKYGVIKNVSDREYFSNSFHCHVSEDITPIEKQDSEKRFWDLFDGGKIQYCKYPISYNTKYIATLVKRAMKLGFYEGVNLSLAYCEDCGYEQLEMDICPKCYSKNITKVNRMNGYLGYTKIKGRSMYNDSKLAEIKDRKSM